MDHNVVADQTHLVAALYAAVGDHTAGNLAHLGDVEDFQDFRVAHEGFAHFRGQLATHRCLDVVNEVIDDIVIADFDAKTLRCIACLRICTHVETQHRSTRRRSKRHVAFVDTAHGIMHDA